ncbi:MAG: hypothetical protein RI897_769 [Verrucomicrobiota bacterium]
MFFDAFTAGEAHFAGFLFIAEDLVDGVGEGFGVLWWDEQSGGAWDDDFLDTSDGAGDDWGFAGHGFEVNDAEGFVDGRAGEDAGVGIEFDVLFFAEEGIDPEDAGFTGDLFGDFGFDLRGIRGAGAADELDAGVDVFHGFDEVDHAFLAAGAAEEEDIVLGDIEGFACGFAGAGVPDIEVDAVVDDFDAFGVDIEEVEDFGAGVLGDGDDAVGGFEGDFFDPGGEVVGSAELFFFPGAEGFEAMDGGDEGGIVEHFGHEAGE